MSLSNSYIFSTGMLSVFVYSGMESLKNTHGNFLNGATLFLEQGGVEWMLLYNFILWWQCTSLPDKPSARQGCPADLLRYLSK